MKSAVTLTLRLSSSDARKSLASVLAPDNEGLPKGLKLSMKVRGSVFKFVVESDSPPSAVSTVLALLRDTTLFQEVWLLSHGERARVGA